MASTRPSLLFLTTDVPYPADSGGRLKTFKLLEQLSGSFDVKLLCAFGGSRKEDINDLKERIPLESIQAFQNHLPRTGLHFLNAILSAPSFNAYRVYSKEFETMVKWSAASSDLVLVDHLEMIDQLPETTDSKLVYHSHNAEYVLWEEFATIKGTFLSKWLYDWEASRVKMLERYTIRRAHFTFAAPNDVEALCKISGIESSMFRNTFHLGNDQLLQLPPIALESNAPDVFYAGTLSWEPNRDGLQWFLQQCWPIIKSRLPDANFHVCGRGADEALRTIMANNEGVVYHGFVEALDGVMSKSRCAVVPLRMGSGMKIKTFDALYRGLPLVTTTTGAEGIDLENKTHAWIVDSPGAFAEAVISTIHDPHQSTIMRNSARQLCEQSYRYAALLQQMEKDLHSLL